MQSNQRALLALGLLLASCVRSACLTHTVLRFAPGRMQYMIGQRYMDLFRTMATQASSKVRGPVVLRAAVVLRMHSVRGCCG